MRIFLVANIVFAACWSNGAIRRLLREFLAKGHSLLVDEYVLIEARRNLEAKSRDGMRELDLLTPKLETVPFMLHLDPTIEAALPEKDRLVLASAIHSSCDALVTGDRRHFGRLYGRTIRGVAIHDPASLAEALLL
ncbi:PIN domain-containing protein [Reyranella sp.]|uniref:PIN domain-containing protein n=1 Tax=Reyranella sp. TaxID=1929291 RepID=UPI003D107AE9